MLPALPILVFAPGNWKRELRTPAWEVRAHEAREIAQQRWAFALLLTDLGLKVSAQPIELFLWPVVVVVVVIKIFF